MTYTSRLNGVIEPPITFLSDSHSCAARTHPRCPTWIPPTEGTGPPTYTILDPCKSRGTTLIIDKSAVEVDDLRLLQGRDRTHTPFLRLGGTPVVCAVHCPPRYILILTSPLGAQSPIGIGFPRGVRKPRVSPLLRWAVEPGA
jgi:hypothetical protein